MDLAVRGVLIACGPMLTSGPLSEILLTGPSARSERMQMYDCHLTNKHCRCTESGALIDTCTVQEEVIYFVLQKSAELLRHALL